MPTTLDYIGNLMGPIGVTGAPGADSTVPGPPGDDGINGTDGAAANVAEKTVAFVTTRDGNNTRDIFGMSDISITGTVVAISATTANGFTSTRRVRALVQTPATNAIAGWRATNSTIWRGNAAGLGGFKAQFRVGPDTGQTIAGRMFTGLTLSISAPTDVEPSTLVDMIGVGYDAADTQLYVMHNDATGTATKVATGLTRSSVDQTKVYAITIECTANASEMTVTVRDELAAATFTTVVSTNLPTNAAFFKPHGWCSVGGVNSVIGMSFMGYYSETDR